MKKIIALGGSNSKDSINKKLAVYAANQLEDVAVTVVDLNDYDIPMYGIDLENEKGIPRDIVKLNDLFETVDGFVISLAEHNGAYTAAFKSVYDWLSRVDKKVWKEKPMLLMATSPGKGGASTVLGIGKEGFKHLGGAIVASFSLPSFNDNFTDGAISDASLKEKLSEKIQLFKAAI